MVLTADKGVALVVIDKEEYIQKAHSLLDQTAYKTINRDPTNRIKTNSYKYLEELKGKQE